MAERDKLATQPIVDEAEAERPLPTLPVDEPDAVTFRWTLPDVDVLVDADHFTTTGQADLTFWYETGQNTHLLLPTTTVNLKSASARASVIKQIRDTEDSLQYLPWQWIVNCIAFKVLKNARQGEGVQTIWPAEDDSLTPTYLLEPLLYLNHPTVIFGDYGSLKSLFALVVAYVVQLPLKDNGLGLTTLDQSTVCLYADYEDEGSTFGRRWGAIQRGFGIEAMMPIEYRRMTAPLGDSIDSLGKAIKEKKIRLLIVDSLGPAARGNLNDPEPAIRYHEALRKLGITSLTLAHNAKDPLTKRRTIFGSVFFTNLARSVWEIKSEQEMGENEAIVSLKHHKANLSRLHPTLGYKFTFTDNSIAIARTDLRDTGLSNELSLRQRIVHILKDGALSLETIADQLASSNESVRRTLYRMKERGEVSHLPDHTWGLRVRDT